jgi:hypothetical protein
MDRREPLGASAPERVSISVSLGFTQTDEGLRAPRPAPGPVLDLAWFVRYAVEPQNPWEMLLNTLLTVGFHFILCLFHFPP